MKEIEKQKLSWKIDQAAMSSMGLLPSSDLILLNVLRKVLSNKKYISLMSIKRKH